MIVPFPEFKLWAIITRPYGTELQLALKAHYKLGTYATSDAIAEINPTPPARTKHYQTSSCRCRIAATADAHDQAPAITAV